MGAQVAFATPSASRPLYLWWLRASSTAQVGRESGQFRMRLNVRAHKVRPHHLYARPLASMTRCGTFCEPSYGRR